jgi:hypothetical protein
MQNDASKGEVMPTDAIVGELDKKPFTPVFTVKFRQPSHEFTFGVGINFISYPLVLTTLV